jgi:hypothetical protein
MQAQRRFVADPRAANDTAPAMTVIAPTAASTGLDDREVHAVAVGRADAFRYGWSAAPQPTGPLRRLASWIATLVGLQRVTPFADDRLEALRLFTCMMRRGDRRLDDLAARLLAAGFSQAELLQATNLALA